MVATIFLDIIWRNFINRSANPIEHYNAKATLDELIADEKLVGIYKAKTNLEKQSFRYSNLLIEENDPFKTQEIEGKLRILRPNIDKSRQEFHDFFVSTINEKHPTLRDDQRRELVEALKNRYIEYQSNKERSKKYVGQSLSDFFPPPAPSQSFETVFKSALKYSFLPGIFIHTNKFDSDLLSNGVKTFKKMNLSGPERNFTSAPSQALESLLKRVRAHSSCGFKLMFPLHSGLFWSGVLINDAETTVKRENVSNRTKASTSMPQKPTQLLITYPKRLLIEYPKPPLLITNTPHQINR